MKKYLNFLIFSFLLGILVSFNIQSSYAQLPAMSNPCDHISVPYNGDTYTANLYGAVCWFTENMRNTQYDDGTDIPDVRLYDDNDANLTQFGRLYTWAAATRLTAGETNTDSIQGLCPEGWYIPRAVDFQNLANLIGGANVMKSADPSYWLGREVGLSPADGFNGQPGGFYNADALRYENILGQGYFWSSTSTTVLPMACSLQYGCPQALINEYNSGNGFSVRCVKYYYPPVLKDNLALSEPTFTTLDATVSLASSGSQIPVVKFFAYTEPTATGTPAMASDYIDAVIVGGDTTYSTTLTGLTPGTKYYVKAVAYNFFGSDASNIANATTLKLVVTSDHAATFSACSDTVLYTATVVGDYTAADMQYAWSSTPLAGIDGSTPTQYKVGYINSSTNTVECQASYRGTSETVTYTTTATITTTPVIQDTAISVGSGQLFTFVPDGSADGNIVPATTTYSWSAPTSTTVTGMSAGSNASDFSQTLATTEWENQTITYTLTPTNTSACPGETFDVIVTVIPVRNYCGIANTSELLSNERGSFNHLDSVQDYDGNWYEVIQFGTQCWTKQNLRSTHNASGNSINYEVPNNGENLREYGYYYNRSTMMNGGSYSTSSPSGVQGICPTGWHIPSRAEFETLLDYVNNDAQYRCNSSAQSTSKALAATTGWGTSSQTCSPGYEPSTNNATGFGAVPAGHYYCCDSPDPHKELGEWAHFWTCTRSTSDASRNYAYNICKTHEIASKENNNVNGYSNFDTYWGYSSTHISVRCVRD